MDFEDIKVGENFQKLFFLKDNPKEIIYFNKNDIITAKVDNSNKLKEKKLIFIKNFNQGAIHKLKDFIKISDSKLGIIYHESILTLTGSTENTMLLIKSLSTGKSYEYKIGNNFSKVIFFKEKNQIIIVNNNINNNILYFWKFIKNIQKYEFFIKISLNFQFILNILNRNTFILARNDCLLLYNANTLQLKKKILYDDKENKESHNKNNNNRDKYEYEEDDIGYEGNYEYKEDMPCTGAEIAIKACLSNDKKYLAISNDRGRLFIYETKNFKKEKIKKFENFFCFSMNSDKNHDKEMEKINTILISQIDAVKNYFILKIRFDCSINETKKYKNGLIPLKKEGDIWKFKHLLNMPFSLDQVFYNHYEFVKDTLFYEK